MLYNIKVRNISFSENFAYVEWILRIFKNNSKKNVHSHKMKEC